MNIFWFLPTHGDSRYLGTTEGARAVDRLDDLLLAQLGSVGPPNGGI